MFNDLIISALIQKKMGKFKKNKTTSVKLLNVPLDQQLSEPTQIKNRQKVRNRHEDDDKVIFLKLLI